MNKNITLLSSRSIFVILIHFLILMSLKINLKQILTFNCLKYLFLEIECYLLFRSKSKLWASEFYSTLRGVHRIQEHNI